MCSVIVHCVTKLRLRSAVCSRPTPLAIGAQPPYTEDGQTGTPRIDRWRWRLEALLQRALTRVIVISLPNMSWDDIDSLSTIDRLIE